jgi:hypothetical protein
VRPEGGLVSRHLDLNGDRRVTAALAILRRKMPAGTPALLACFAVCPEYVINIALRGSRDGTVEYSVERQRGGSWRIGWTTQGRGHRTSHGTTHRTTDRRSVRVLPALLLETYGAKL